MLKNFIKNNQQSLILCLGYLLVAALGFYIGRVTDSKSIPPEIRVEQAFLPLNNNSESPLNQPATADPAKPTALEAIDACQPNQIKGNIGATGTKVYHKPGGSFYNRTKAEACFNTEEEAVAAGFRKSSN